MLVLLGTLAFVVNIVLLIIKFKRRKVVDFTIDFCVFACTLMFLGRSEDMLMIGLLGSAIVSVYLLFSIPVRSPNV